MCLLLVFTLTRYLLHLSSAKLHDLDDGGSLIIKMPVVFVLASALLNEHDFKSNDLSPPLSLWLWESFLNYPAFKTIPQIRAVSIKRLFYKVWWMSFCFLEHSWVSELNDALSISDWQLPATQMADCLSHCLLSNIFAANLFPIWGNMLVWKEHFSQTFHKRNTGFLPPPPICTIFLRNLDLLSCRSIIFLL